MLGAQTIIGRLFGPAESGVLVLSHALWARHFGADPNVVGRVVSLHGVIPRTEPKAYTVIGVMPPGFGIPIRRRSSGRRSTSVAPAPPA